MNEKDLIQRASLLLRLAKRVVGREESLFVTPTDIVNVSRQCHAPIRYSHIFLCPCRPIHTSTLPLLQHYSIRQQVHTFFSF